MRQLTRVTASPLQTVKFVESPTVEQLRRQMQTLVGKMDMLIRAPQNFDVDMEIEGGIQYGEITRSMRGAIYQ